MKTDTQLASRGTPPVLAVIIPLLGAIIAYIVLAGTSELGRKATVWWQHLFDAAPALLVFILFEVFALLPLRALFIRKRIGTPLLFFVASALAWVVISVAILSATTSLPRLGLWADALMMVPGLVLAGLFTLMCPAALRR
jgi:hypothetical protein